jgi:hypothetical protein
VPEPPPPRENAAALPTERGDTTIAAGAMLELPLGRTRARLLYLIRSHLTRGEDAAEPRARPPGLPFPLTNEKKKYRVWIRRCSRCRCLRVVDARRRAPGPRRGRQPQEGVRPPRASSSSGPPPRTRPPAGDASSRFLLRATLSSSIHVIELVAHSFVLIHSFPGNV